MRYRGKYVRPVYWGDSKLRSWIQQAATVLEGIFCMVVVGAILIAIIGAICMAIGG